MKAASFEKGHFSGCDSAYAPLDLEAALLKGIHPLSSDRVQTYAERVGASAALLVMIGFGLVAIGEPVWRLMKMTLPDLESHRWITTLLIIVVVLLLVRTGNIRRVCGQSSATFA